jgi:hypothetical protein
MQIGCLQNKNAQKNEIPKIESMDEKINCIVPEDIKKFIESTTVFAIANISSDGVENMANDMFLLDEQKVFIRIENEEYPEGENLFFSDELDIYKTDINENNYFRFLKYLDSINTPNLITEYNTPEELSVMGGMKHFVYIKTKSSTKWLCFEPESGDFIKEINKEFNKVLN